MFARQLACANAEPPRKRARRRGYPAPVAPRAMQRAQSIRGVSGGAGKMGKFGSRARRPSQIRARGEGRNPPRTARACPGERRCEKGRRGARGNGRGGRTSSLSLSRFLCAWVTSLATACDSSLRTDSSLMMANAWLMSMGRALNEGRDIFAALPAAQLEILRCAPITAVRSPFRADGTVTRCTSRIDRITRATHDTHGSSPADRSACPPGLGCGGARFPLWAGNDDYAFALSLQELVFDSLLKIGISQSSILTGGNHSAAENWPIESLES